LKVRGRVKIESYYGGGKHLNGVDVEAHLHVSIFVAGGEWDAREE